MMKEEFKFGSEVIQNDRYVDDLLSGSNDSLVRAAQIIQAKDLLGQGGFSLKFVAKSGENPPPEASSDGESLKILGYKWFSKADKLGLGFEEINFNKRQRGAKKPNPFPVISESDVKKILDTVKLSRRKVVAKMAEFYDPLGIFEPYKLQLKLDVSKLNGMGWDEILPDDLQAQWEVRMKQFTEIPDLIVNRCVIPQDAVNPEKY